MNHQELLRHSFETEVMKPFSLLIKLKDFFGFHPGPRFFSGWPYFVFILAALLMGSTKVSSQGFNYSQKETPKRFLNFAGVESPLTNLQALSKRKFVRDEISECRLENSQESPSWITHTSGGCEKVPIFDRH